MSNKVEANPLPTLEQALELSKRYRTPKNNHIFIMAPLVPTFTASGVKLDESALTKLQDNAIKKGVLVVHSAYTGEEENPNQVSTGDLVLYSPAALVSYRAILKSEMPLLGVDAKTISKVKAQNNKMVGNAPMATTRYFILMCIRASDVICTLNDIEG